MVILFKINHYNQRENLGQIGSTCSNPLPNDKILAWSKLKAFAEDKLNQFGEVSAIFIKFEIVCKFFQFGRV